MWGTEKLSVTADYNALSERCRELSLRLEPIIIFTYIYNSMLNSKRKDTIMKSVYRNVLFVFLTIIIGCQQQQQTPTGIEKESVQKEVKDQFNKLISAINNSNAPAWSEFYSKDEFISTFVSTDFYATRSAFIDSITYYFSMRKRQHVEPLEVQVTALTSTLALMTSQEKTEMLLKNGKNNKSRHVFTMIWKKEKDGWKIIHSHESWFDEQVN